MAGRPEGGLAILWKKESAFRVTGIKFTTNCIIFTINVFNVDILLVNVYINGDNGDAASSAKYVDFFMCIRRYFSWD